MAGKSGMAYDFIIYQGKSTEICQQNLKTHGLGASVVLHLTDCLKSKGHKIFIDNYFTSYNLIEILDQKQMYCTGTVRLNRFCNPPLSTDAELKRSGRGSSDEVVSKDGVIGLVKWLDSKSVVLASNCITIGETDFVQRWDKTNKRYETVSRPEIVKMYNLGMGGVDLLDQYISYYRIFIKSVKWPLRVIFHFVDFAVVQSFLEYKKDCEYFSVSKKETLDLIDFRLRIANSLVYSQKYAKKKRGRPTTLTEPTQDKRSKIEKRPIEEIRYDSIDHLPIHDQKKESGRCKMTGCSGKSHIVCKKCKIHLCLNKDNNCFEKYHTK